MPFYFVKTNEDWTIQFLPDRKKWNNPYLETITRDATIDDVEMEIKKWESRTDEWSVNYVKSLKSKLGYKSLMGRLKDLITN